MTDDTLTSSDGWPLVAPDDDGIRPAGQPQTCFYCHRKVGEEHERDCVIVTRRVEHRVGVKLPDGTVARGLWVFEEPHDSDVQRSEFYRNESSWCANNMLRPSRTQEAVRWENEDDAAKVEALRDRDDVCLCEHASFSFVRVVDPTPRRHLRPIPSENS